MKKVNIQILVLILFLKPIIGFGKNTDANIVGHVIANGEHLPYASISIKGKAIGCSTDETGHYRLINMQTGKHTIQAKSLGYKTEEKEVHLKEGETIELNFQLEPEIHDLEEIVIRRNKHVQHREKNPQIINSISPQLLSSTQSISLGDGLNYCPGLRMETNCVNSGFPQVRINGLDGVYSQILINGKRIFKGMASVFGLEQIPSSLIERVEIIRGGASATQGRGGIAGTIDLILKDPINNTYEFGYNMNLIGLGLENAGTTAKDHIYHLNTSVISSNTKSGISLYAFHRKRDPFDANEDSFSEIPKLKNTTFGARAYYKLNRRNKLSLDLMNIEETRRSGNQFNLPVYSSEMGTQIVQHNLTGSLNYDQILREMDKFSIYLTAQDFISDSYKGAKGMPIINFLSKENSFGFGTRYDFQFQNSKLILGLEDDLAKLSSRQQETDKPQEKSNIQIVLADQVSNTLGAFAQYEKEFGSLLLSMGARIDRFDVQDKGDTNFSKEGFVFSPRINLKYNLSNALQARLSYAKAFRNPEIRDEDLMVDLSGSTKLVYQVSSGLKEETSHSYVASLDFNKQIHEIRFGFLIEAFYTQLNNPFAQKADKQSETGTIIYTRYNADHSAKVRGVNLELKLEPNSKLQFNGGFSYQKSEYSEAQEFGVKDFFRSPNSYAYLNMDWSLMKNFNLSLNGNYTGEMYVPLYGSNSELRKSEKFYDLAAKLSYTIHYQKTNINIFAGMKNIFNSYQNDFEKGLKRFPGYIYGPRLPRTIYVGVKLGNILH